MTESRQLAEYISEMLDATANHADRIEPEIQAIIDQRDKARAESKLLAKMLTRAMDSFDECNAKLKEIANETVD